MNYERQEQAFDPIANREREDERADFAGLTCPDSYRETWADMARQDAMQRPATIPELPAIGNHLEINAAWMEERLTDRDWKGVHNSRRKYWPILAACDADAYLWQSFYHMRPAKDSGFPVFGGARIHINRITLSEGWSK